MRHASRLLPGIIGVGAVLVATAGVSFVIAAAPPAPVSVRHVVDRFRTTDPSASPRPGGLPAGPAAGVYLYATTGGERVSVGGVAHTYPKTTTLSVTYSGCGLDVRWDALSGRSQEWRFCPADGQWRLQDYVDMHKFLYLQDVHRYTCTGGAWTLTQATATVVCDTGTSRATSAISRVGSEVVSVQGTRVPVTHLHITQSATGASLSSGSLDLWLASSSGLPVRAQTVVTGSQTVLGQRVTYRETATYRLESLTPRR